MGYPCVVSCACLKLSSLSLPPVVRTEFEVSLRSRLGSDLKCSFPSSHGASSSSSDPSRRGRIRSPPPTLTPCLQGTLDPPVSVTQIVCNPVGSGNSTGGVSLPKLY